MLFRIVCSFIIITIDFRMNDQHSIDIVDIQDNYEKCPKCLSQILIIQGQRYCENCKQTPIMLFQQIRNVHQNYRPNSETFKCSGLVKIQQYTQTILKSLNLFETQSTINEIVQKVVCLHKHRGINRKGYFVECAVVIFMNFLVQHKMTSRQFCSKFKVSIKRFNKIYYGYRQLQRRDKQGEENISQIKLQQKLENESVKMEHSQQNFSMEEQSEEMPISMMQIGSFENNFDFEGKLDFISSENIDLEGLSKSKLEALTEKSDKSYEKNEEISHDSNENEIEKTTNFSTKLKCIILQLYDSLFDSHFMREIKERVTVDLVQKMESVIQIHRKKYKETLKIYNEYQKILYQLFGVVKAFGYKISLKSYKSVIEKSLNLSLNIKKLGCVKKQIESIVKICKDKNKDKNKDKKADRKQCKKQNLSGIKNELNAQEGQIA